MWPTVSLPAPPDGLPGAVSRPLSLTSHHTALAGPGSGQTAINFASCRPHFSTSHVNLTAHILSHNTWKESEQKVFHKALHFVLVTWSLIFGRCKPHGKQWKCHTLCNHPGIIIYLCMASEI